jgi:hypothetical protein
MNFSSDPINNLENLHANNKTKSISIYFVVLLALFAFLALLPIIAYCAATDGNERTETYVNGVRVGN